MFYFIKIIMPKYWTDLRYGIWNALEYSDELSLTSLHIHPMTIVDTYSINENTIISIF